MPIYQHVIPKHPEECDSDPIRVQDNLFQSDNELRCSSCHARIKVVDENEGPESLKALLRF